MNQKPGCWNCLNWFGNKMKSLGLDLKGPKDICTGGFHNKKQKDPTKDGIWTGWCEDFRTGPKFFCNHHVSASWAIINPPRGIKTKKDKG